LIGFIFSGLVHEVVISLPARAWYGGPTLFFAIQGAGILAERTRVGRKLGLGTGFRGWLFTMTLLALPAPLLFHQAFVLKVVVPFVDALVGL
jgi:alginate O-acetyltransferase complex protein AlgI